MPITVRQLFEAGQESLGLVAETGADFMDQPITEEALNRPGLALAGFFQYFALRRVQVFGLAEYSYLKSLPGWSNCSSGPSPPLSSHAAAMRRSTCGNCRRNTASRCCGRT